MSRSSEIEARLHALETLHEAVAAMKSLSAHHFRQARAAVDPARIYREGVARIAAEAGAHLPAGEGPGAVLAVGADLGLCGGYNARIAEAAAELRAQLGPGPTFCVGRRAASLLARNGITAAVVYPTPSRPSALAGLLLGLAEAMLSTFIAGRLSSLDVVSARFEGVGAERPAVERLLPIGETVPGGARVRYVRPAHLADAAARERLYITLHSLLLEALAAEHAARLDATSAAERWLEGRVGGLRRALAAARREASTQEVIEIAGGARQRRRTEGA